VKNKNFIFILLISALLLISCEEKFPPLSLHPDNPHYFQFRGGRSSPNNNQITINVK